MTLIQRGLDSTLITEQNSAGILEESVVQEAPLPKAVRTESTPQETVVPNLEGAVAPSTQVSDTPVDSYSMDALPNPYSQQGERVREEFLESANTSLLDSLGASVKLFDAVGAYDVYKLEQQVLDNETGLYTPDADFDVREAISMASIPLSKEEAVWLNEKDITSQGAFNLYIKNIEDTRKLARTAGESPIASTVLGFLDPTYIPLGLAVGKSAQVARMGRFGTSAVVGASEYAMVEAQSYHRPVTNVERVMGAVLPSVITLGLYRNPTAIQRLNGSSEVGEGAIVGKGKLSTPEFDSTSGRVNISNPKVDVVDYASTIDTINAIRNSPLTTDFKVVTPKVKLDADGVPTPYKTNQYGMPARDAIDWKATNSSGKPYSNSALRWVYDVIEDSSIPQSVRDSTYRLWMQAGKELSEFNVSMLPKLKDKGRFVPKRSDIKLRGNKKTSPKDIAQTLNHEIVHGLTSLRLHYGRLNPNSAHGVVAKEIDDLRKHVNKRYQERKGEFKPRERKEIEYALQDSEEFLAGLYEGDTAFRRLMQETPSASIKQGGEKTLLQSLYQGFRKLMGLTREEASSLNKALGLSDDLIDTPIIRYTDLDGNVKEFKASEVTPKLIEETASAESQRIFDQLGYKLGKGLSWNLYDTIAKASPAFARLILSNPTQGSMTSNVVSSKRALSSRLGIHRNNAEQMINKELSNRGISIVDRSFSTKKYKEALWELEAEVAFYVEQRSQAGKQGIKLPDGDDAVARIAKEYNAMTQEAKAVGVRSGIFGEAVGDVDWYLPRKIDPENYMTQLRRLQTIYGEEDAVNRMIDLIAKSLQFESGGAEYARHIAYIYHKRMHDSYHAVGDSFRSHLGDAVVQDVNKYLDELGVTDPTARQHISDIVTGAVDKRGEASFQKTRLDIDTLGEHILPDGSTFRFYDLMNHKVIDPYARYADNVSGRVALADHGLGTPTLWSKAREEVTNSEYLMNKPALRQRYADIVDDIYNDLLGYPVGEKLHPFLIAMRAFTQSVALKFSGIWQVMEVVPTLARHAKANGLSDTFKIAGTSLFKTMKGIEKTHANDLATVLARSSMDDLKFSPLSSRMADNHDLNMNTFSSKIMHLSQYTHVVNGMRYLMGKQSILSANLIVDNLKKANMGQEGSKTLLRKFGFNDADFKALKSQMDLHGTDFNRWDLDAKGELLPKLINLMDTDVLRSRTGEIPAIMQYSQVGKVLGTFRNFILSAHNKIFTSQLRDEGILSVALLTAYQLPVAMMSVQVASMAKGEGMIEDPVDLFQKAFAQLGGLGLIPEAVGILSGDTRGFGSPFMLGLDRVIGIGNAIGSGDPLKMLEASTNAIPILSVTLGFQAGVDAVLSTLRENKD